MSKESHPDADYLKGDEIGMVIAKAMAVTYRADPANPIDYFAKWLLNHSKVQKTQVLQEEKQVQIKEQKEKHEGQNKLKEKEQAQKNLEEKSKQQAIDQFKTKVTSSKDLSDELQSLVDHLKDFTDSTAVYVGKIVLPIKPITEKSDDTAHVLDGAQPQIQFMNATKDHPFLVDQILKQDQGITFKAIFEGEEEVEEAPVEEEPELDEEGNPIPKPEKPKPEKLPKFKLVEEVVREPNMHYFQVPRLGSYLAIKLEYDSCLFEDSFDDAVMNYAEVASAKQELQVKKNEFEEQQNEAKLEKEENGEEFIPEEKEWEEIEYAPFKTQKVQYVVCLNTMGKDRKFDEAQKLTALRTVQMFRDRWEALEKENLESDVLKKLERQEYDKVYKEHYESQDQAELDKIVEDAIANHMPGEGEENVSDAEKAMVGHKSRFLRVLSTFYAPNQAAQHKAKMDRMEKEKLKSAGGDRAQSAMGSNKDGSIGDDKSMAGGAGVYTPLVPEQWKEKIRDMRFLYVVKYQRIFQALFYILKYQDRPFLCERDTNKIQWKKVKNFLNNDELFIRMSEYWPFGPKEENYKEYQKLKFVQNNLADIAEDAVDEYSVALGKLLRWINLAIEVRIEDLKIRRAHKKQLRAERQEALDKEAERMEKRGAEFEVAKAAHDEKMAAEEEARKAAQEEGAEPEEDEAPPEFDSEEFYAVFDENNLPIEIPEEVEDDIDNDFNLIIEESVMEAE